MIAFSHAHADNAHDRFLAMLPSIKQYASAAFRDHQPEEREDLVEEVVANAFVAFARLVQVGKQDIAYATPLATYAVRRVRSGRCVGCKLHIRDVMSPANRRVVVEHLDRFDWQRGEWQEALVEDRHAGPAETAAARIDMAAWLRSLGGKKRQIAQTLAKGERTGKVAAKYGLTAGRVSQLRRELEESWEEYQGMAVA